MTIDNNFQISSTKFINPLLVGSIVSGILLGLNAPGFGTHWIGLVSFFPLLLTLEQLNLFKEDNLPSKKYKNFNNLDIQPQELNSLLEISVKKYN